MNTTRVALAAVAATLADAVYGFIVYGNLLAGRFAAFPAVFRSTETGAARLRHPQYQRTTGGIHGPGGPRGMAAGRRRDRLGL